jgi:hypothetical protein
MQVAASVLVLAVIHYMLAAKDLPGDANAS